MLTPLLLVLQCEDFLLYFMNQKGCGNKEKRSLTFPDLNLIIRGLPLFLPVARQELLHGPRALAGVLEQNPIKVNMCTVFTHR